MPEELGHKLVALDLLGDFELLDRPPPLNDARAHGAAAGPLAARRGRLGLETQSLRKHK